MFVNQLTKFVILMSVSVCIACTCIIYTKKREVREWGQTAPPAKRGAKPPLREFSRRPRSPAYLSCSHIEIYTCLRVAARNNAVAFYLPARQLRPGPDRYAAAVWTSDNTRGTTWANHCAATAAFYNLFIPLSLRRCGVSEGKINFTLYLNVKSYGFDRISFQIVLINLLLRGLERGAAVDRMHTDRAVLSCSILLWLFCRRQQ